MVLVSYRLCALLIIPLTIAVSFESLFKRCVTGCSSQSPSCPECPDNQICSLVPPTCDECQKTVCVASSAAPSSVSSSTSTSSSGPNVGAIAGGVVGGVAVIAAVTYLVWRFCIKNKRQAYQEEDWGQFPDESVAAEKDFNARRDARASTHTVGSIASTVLTRASNIIQIAYIPGVTNRSGPSTPGVLVPPVPPIPIALSNASTPRYEQEHFFMPGDLRDSTYSGMSDRTSYARTSVASTIYGKHAIVSPMPAQTVIRGKAAVVSVKSNGASSGGEATPPVPNVDYSKYTPRPASPAFSVGSTFLSSANAVSQTRPQVVRVISAKQKSSANSIVEEDVSKTDSSAITIIDDTPTMYQSPFGDRTSSSTLGVVIEEATKNKVGKSPRKSGTPFGDEHEVRE